MYEIKIKYKLSRRMEFIVVTICFVAAILMSLDGWGFRPERRLFWALALYSAYLIWIIIRYRKNKTDTENTEE